MTVPGMFGNMFANQASGLMGSGSGIPAPFILGKSTMTTPLSYAQVTANGPATSMVGPLGVSSSVSLDPTLRITALNTSNILGAASPFATLQAYTSRNGVFGEGNPTNPIIGTPFDVTNGLAQALGNFGNLYNTGQQNPLLALAGLYNNPLAGAPPANTVPSGFPLGQQTGGQAVAGGAGGFANSLLGAGQQLAGAFAPQLASYFPAIDPNAIVGFGQSLSHIGSSNGNRYNVYGDGTSKLFAQSIADPLMPRSMYGATSYLKNALGTFQTVVNSRGGSANAGYLGAQASGDASAIVFSPTGAIASIANPIYDRTNFAQQSTFSV